MKRKAIRIEHTCRYLDISDPTEYGMARRLGVLMASVPVLRVGRRQMVPIGGLERAPGEELDVVSRTHHARDA